VRGFLAASEAAIGVRGASSSAMRLARGSPAAACPPISFSSRSAAPSPLARAGRISPRAPSPAEAVRRRAARRAPAAPGTSLSQYGQIAHERSSGREQLPQRSLSLRKQLGQRTNSGSMW